MARQLLTRLVSSHWIVGLFILFALLLLACGAAAPPGPTSTPVAIQSPTERATNTPVPIASPTATSIPIRPATKKEQVLTQTSYQDFKLAVQGRFLVFETLLSLDENGNPIPNLAESWQVSPDGKTYTFNLRKGVKFHDGTLFNAETAKFSVEYYGTRQPYGKFIDRIEAVDDYTLRIHLKSAYWRLLPDLGTEFTAKVISPTAVKPIGDVKGNLEDYVGTGPFKLLEYKKDQEAILVQNQQYWRGAPKLDRVVWKVVPDPNTQVLALQAGEVDLIGAAEHHSALPYTEIAKLRKDPRFEVILKSYGRYQVIDFNAFRPPFDDVRVRKAVNLALDRDLMVKTVFEGLTAPAYHLAVPAPGWEWGPRNIEGFRHDPQQARRLLAEAGWAYPSGGNILAKGGDPFKVELIVPRGEANADVVALFVQSELKKVGIDLSVVNMESGAAGSRKREGKYDLVVHHACGKATMACLGLDGKYSSLYTWKAGVYHSPELDAQIGIAFTTQDVATRRAAFDRIWETIHQQAASIPLYDITKPVVFHKKVKGFQMGNTMFEMNLLGVTID